MPTRKKRAVTALELVVSRYPNTPAAELAREKIEELTGTSPAADHKQKRAGSRTWTDRTGKFQTEAAIVAYKTGWVKLKIKKGDTFITLPLKKLAKSDRDYVKQWLADKEKQRQR